MTHTPGPWTTKRGGYGGYAVECNGRTSYPASKAVCTVRPYPRTAEAHHEAEATARLIAAAPDMLAALQEVKRHVGMPDNDKLGPDATLARTVNTAIAKATGGET